jgi:hypothetical protein
MNEQFSEDRQWWWNGREWIPASQAPKQPRPPTRPPPGAELLATLLATLVTLVTTLPARVMASRHRNLILMASGLGALMVLAFLVALASNPQFQPGYQAGSTAASPTATPQLFDPNAQRAADPTPIPTTTPPPAAAPALAATPNPAGSCSPQPCANDNYGWILTVSNVKYDARSANEFEKPEQGNVFVTMIVTFTNKRDQEQHANPTTFVLLDGSGVKHSWKPMISGNCQTWDPVNVTPGATFGPRCLSFEASAATPAGLVLLWTPTLAGGDYKLKLS